MSEKMIEAQGVILDKINLICKRYGLNNVMAQLYAILYMNGKPLSLDEMSNRLRISKGSTSVNIRSLERYGAVRRVLIRGTRRDYYEAEMDIHKVMIERVKSMAEKRLSEIDDMLKSSRRVLDSVSTGSEEDNLLMEAFGERLKKLSDLQSQAVSMFELFKIAVINRTGSVGLNEQEKKAVAKDNKE